MKMVLDPLLTNEPGQVKYQFQRPLDELVTELGDKNSKSRKKLKRSLHNLIILDNNREQSAVFDGSTLKQINRFLEKNDVPFTLEKASKGLDIKHTSDSKDLKQDLGMLADALAELYAISNKFVVPQEFISKISDWEAQIKSSPSFSEKAKTYFSNVKTHLGEIKQNIKQGLLSRLVSPKFGIPAAASMIMPLNVARQDKKDIIGNEIYDLDRLQLLDAFWIYKDGRRITSYPANRIDIDADSVSSMLTAITSYVQTSFSKGAVLNEMDFTDPINGEKTKIHIIPGEYSCLAFRFVGKPPSDFGIFAKDILSVIENKNMPVLENWKGYVAPILEYDFSENLLRGYDSYKENKKFELENELITEKKLARRRKFAYLATAIMVLSALGGAVFYASTLKPKETEKPIPAEPPVLADVPDMNVIAGEPLDLHLIATDKNNDTLTYGANWKSNRTNLPVNPATGRLHIDEVPDNWVGKHDIQAWVSDNKYVVYDDFNLTVHSKNLPPYLEKAEVTMGKLALYPKIIANDSDTGVGGITVHLDDKVYDQLNSEIYDKRIDFGNFTPGTHELSFKARDATNASLFSESFIYPFNLTDKPKLEKINLTQEKDDVTLKISAYTEVGNVSRIIAEFEGKNYEAQVNMREASTELKIPLNGLPIKDYKIKIYALADSGNISDAQELLVKPFDDPATAKFILDMTLEDILNWKIVVDDDEGQARRIEITSDMPTPIIKEQNYSPSQHIEISGSIDLSEDRAGTYHLNGTAFLTDDTNVTASASVVIKDDDPLIYAWTINPETASNGFEVAVTGLDKDTYIDRFELDIKKDGVEFDKKTSNINSKSINFKIPLNYELKEPGQIDLTGKLIPKEGEPASEFVVFENVPRVILDDKPIIQSCDINYNPVNRTVDITGNVYDIDSKIGSGTYELVNVDTEQKTVGNLLPIDGKFDSRSEYFNATAQLEGTGLPEGLYNLTVVLKDAQGLEDRLTKQIRINNTYKIIPIWNEDPDAKTSELTWDAQKQVAYLKLLGNNTLKVETINDFEILATPELKDYVKENWTKHIVLDDPLQSAINLHRDVIMNYSAGKDPQSGYEENNKLAIDGRTTFEWIKNEILKNQSISDDIKNKWNRFFTFTVNYENKFPMMLFYYDGNANGKIEDNERWMCYQSLQAPKQYDSSWLFVTEPDMFDITFGTNAVIAGGTEALLDPIDIEHRISGNNWSEIKTTFNINKETAKNIVGLIKNYDSTPADNRAQLKQTAGTVFSLYDKKDDTAMKGRVLEVRYVDGKYTYTVRPAG